jgi:hypothetical protein
MLGPGNHSSKKKKTTTTTKPATATATESTETTVPHNGTAKTTYTALETLQLVNTARLEGLQEGHKAGHIL